MTANTEANLCTVMKPERYDIWVTSFRDDDVIHRCRPAIVVGVNEEFGDVTVVPLTSKLCYRQKPTHVLVNEQGLEITSRGLCELVVSVPGCRLLKRIGRLSDPFDRYALRHALAVHLGLNEYECTDSTCWREGMVC